MATQFHLPVVTAAQIGTYFVGQYYQVLQAQPELVYQFYSEASTMIRVDGSARETAAAMMQIHAMVMSLNYAGIEIKTVHSLESWNGGVLMMLSGSVLINGYNDKRRFVQTFFLAPQETGYFVLNDIFQFIEEEAIHHHPITYLGQSTLDPKVNISASIQGPVSNYMPKEETQSREFVDPADIKENGSGENYGFSEQQLQKPADVENNISSNFVQPDGPLQNSVKSVPEHVAAPVENNIVEPQKHTYASILQVAKGPSIKTMPPRSSSYKPNPPTSEWDQIPEPPAQQSYASSTSLENSVFEAPEDPSNVEEEAEVKSVYVRNIPHTVRADEIEEVFKKFGELKPDAAVAIRNRKDIGVCYAFVEFEDITGVQNAIQASTVELGGQQVFIEGRRANRANTLRGGRRMLLSCGDLGKEEFESILWWIGRGRGRAGYYREAPRGRFVPRNFGRENGQEGNYNYNRPRENGFYRPAPRQDRGFQGNRMPRSTVQNESE